MVWSFSLSVVGAISPIGPNINLLLVAMITRHGLVISWEADHRCKFYRVVLLVCLINIFSIHFFILFIFGSILYETMYIVKLERDALQVLSPEIFFEVNIILLSSIILYQLWVDFLCLCQIMATFFLVLYCSILNCNMHRETLRSFLWKLRLIRSKLGPIVTPQGHVFL